MKISKSFLNTFINIEDTDFYDLAEKLVGVGNEYETISKMSEATGLVIGEVTEESMHPESDKLHITKVKISDTETIQIVCGAPNCKKGIKAVIALPGAVLPGDFKITKTSLAGYESNGMICSLSELGIKEKYQSEEDKSGIHILGSDAVVGEDPIKYLGFDDIVADFELTADRGDLQSIRGFAYEVGAILKRDVIYPNTDYSATKENIKDNHTLTVNTKDCTKYLAKKINNIEIKESPIHIKNRLIASGIRPINNIVDISNYVMLEYGQPLHFFDADKLGTNIEVRNAFNNEEFITLDNIKHNLTEDDIVITDGSKIVASAGVMGGISTGVDENTKNIIIEAAIFDATKVRLTSKKITRSESSMRFEKGIDPTITKESLNRACHLVSTIANGEVMDGTLIHDVVDTSETKITVTSKNINDILAFTLTDEDIEDIFNSLKLNESVIDGLHTVLIPKRRFDLSIKEDLIEEVGRIIGYDHIASTLPKLATRVGNYSDKILVSNIVKKVMASSGLNEVITYSLISEELSEQFVYEPREKIKLASPLSKDRAVMRQSLVPGLISVYEHNKARSNKDIFIYEIGSSYYYDETNKEDTLASGLISGNLLDNKWNKNNITADFYLLKGLVEKTLDFLGFNNRYLINSENLNKDLHPGISGTIYLDNELIGHLGKIHPSINRNDLYIFELNITKIMDKKLRQIKYKEYSEYPSISKDLAFVMPANMDAVMVTNILRKVGGRLISNLDIFDVYTGDNIDDKDKSVAYSVTFNDAKKTLTDDEVMEVFNKMIKEVETKLNVKIRDK